jgi:TRAP-type C4-dicarboxylate transport system permease small subunit
MLKFIKRLNYYIYNGVKWLVVIIFLGLLTLSAVQVVLRLFFKSGIANAETLMRYLVLWVAFLGASLATYKGRHINLDVISKILRKKNKNLVRLLVSLVSFATLCVLFKAGVAFILNEIPDSPRVFFMPFFVLESIIPATFFIMALIYLQGALESIALMVKERKK